MDVHVQVLLDPATISMHTHMYMQTYMAVYLLTRFDRYFLIETDIETWADVHTDMQIHVYTRTYMYCRQRIRQTKTVTDRKQAGVE